MTFRPHPIKDRRYRALPADRMGAGGAVLEVVDVQHASFKIDLVPAQCDNFGGAQVVAVGQHDEERIAIAVAAAPARRHDHAFDLVGRQVLARSKLSVRSTAAR